MNPLSINSSSIWLKPDFDNIPDDLKQQPWAVWLAEPRTEKPGKYNKAPRSPVTGFKIGSNQPHLFGTFEQAKAAYESGNYAGVGVLLTGNGIVGFDIDEYQNTFAKTPEVRAWVEKAISDPTNPAYAELSPSGTGLRLFVRGELPEKGRKSGCLEVYDNVRFLTITGAIYEAR